MEAEALVDDEEPRLPSPPRFQMSFEDHDDGGATPPLAEAAPSPRSPSSSESPEAKVKKSSMKSRQKSRSSKAKSESPSPSHKGEYLPVLWDGEMKKSASTGDTPFQAAITQLAGPMLNRLPFDSTLVASGRLALGEVEKFVTQIKASGKRKLALVRVCPHEMSPSFIDFCVFHKERDRVVVFDLERTTGVLMYVVPPDTKKTLFVICAQKFRNISS